MPTYVQIYFASQDSGDRLLSRVGAALGVRFEPVDRPYAGYRASTGDLVLDLAFSHELEDDAGVPFERMPHVLTVRDLQRGQHEESAAREMFRRLEGLGYRPMYLVKGLVPISPGRE
jgi:hypothetical protein